MTTAGDEGYLVEMKAFLFILLAATAPASAESILFVGNSFTFGHGTPVQTFRNGTVMDLNREGIGGVPALFKRFADQSGLRFDIALETAPGRSLEWHWGNRRMLLDRRWDRVVLQDYSTLDAARPGDPRKHIDFAGRFARLFRARNPRVKIILNATWSRPDLTYLPGQPWSGQPIEAMALDVRRGADRAKEVHPAIGRVVPVGEAFTCAIASRVADANPYDGITPGQINLWGADHYHASTAGYYLEALTLFAAITRRDPRRLGRSEKAAAELGLPPATATALQAIAWRTALGDGCRPAAGKRGSDPRPNSEAS